MRIAKQHTTQIGRPHFQRLMMIVQDHVFYSQSRPDHLVEIASRMRISTDAALAFAIADQITEEFTLQVNAD